MNILKKISIGTIFGLMIFAIGSGTSFAARVWVDVNIKQVRIDAEGTLPLHRIRATSASWGGGAEERNFFIAKGAQEDPMVATALTAMSLGQQATMQIGSDAANNALVFSIGLLTTAAQ